MYTYARKSSRLVLPVGDGCRAAGVADNGGEAGFVDREVAEGVSLGGSVEAALDNEIAPAGYKESSSVTKLNYNYYFKCSLIKTTSYICAYEVIAK